MNEQQKRYTNTIYITMGVAVSVIIGIALTAITKSPLDSSTATSTSSTLQSDSTTDSADLSTSDSTYQAKHGSSECTVDCSGHDAGYSYAEENEICDTEYDSGNSESFNEGVISWAEDNC